MAARSSPFRAPVGPPCWLLALAICGGGCGPAVHFEGGVYREGPLAFRLGELPAPWQRARVRSAGGGGGVAFHHPQGGSIRAGASCERGVDVPLDVLTNHLLMGIEAPAEASREHLTLDGRAALRTRLAGRLDGVDVQLDLVVLRKDGCTYDFQLVAGPATFAARQPDFDRLLAGFRALAGGTAASDRAGATTPGPGTSRSPPSARR